MLINLKRTFQRKNQFIAKNLFSTISSDSIEIPTIDFDKFLNRREGWQNECKIVADCLNETGILVVKDPVKIITY